MPVPAINNMSESDFSHTLSVSPDRQGEGISMSKRKSPSMPIITASTKSSKAPPKHVPLHPNIIVFGHTGAGKSSLVNMIAGEDVAQTSSGLTRCTLDSQPYDVKLDESLSVTLWDTAGLEQESRSNNDTIRRVCELILRLEKDLILLIFCLRGKIQEGAFENYRMFRKLCHTVPMAVVVSGLEREANKAEWWSRNETGFTKAGMKFTDHACIAGIKGDLIPNSDKFVYGEAYNDSALQLKAIIKRAYDAYLSKPTNEAQREWFSRILGIIRVLFIGSDSETVDASELNKKLKKLDLAKKDREVIVKAYKDNLNR